MNRRARKDVTALVMSDLEVELQDDSIMQFHVYIDGPDDTPYSGGRFKLHTSLPENYPYKSPSVGFSTKILHPNVDWRSGSICLDVLNSRWTPVSDLLSVFTQFLPQLLRYPNPSDPLNGEAAQLLLSQPAVYAQRVAAAVDEFALPAGAGVDTSPKALPPAAAGAASGGGAESAAGAQAAQPANNTDQEGDIEFPQPGGGAVPQAPVFDFDGVDLAAMDGASCVSDLSDFPPEEL